MEQLLAFVEYKCEIHGFHWKDNCSKCLAEKVRFQHHVAIGYWIKRGVQEHVAELCDIRKVKDVWKDPYNDKGELLCWCLRIKDVLV